MYIWATLTSHAGVAAHLPFVQDQVASEQCEARQEPSGNYPDAASVFVTTLCDGEPEAVPVCPWILLSCEMGPLIRFAPLSRHVRTQA